VTAETLVFERMHASRRMLIALNFSATAQNVSHQRTLAVLLSTTRRQRPRDRSSRVSLDAYEGIIAEVWG
jgi:hypothetical protein